MNTRTFLQQSAFAAWRRPVSSSPCGSLFPFDSTVASVQRWMKQPASSGKCWMDMQSLHRSGNSLQSGYQKRTRRFVSPVMNAVQPTSEDVPVIDELKAELESLRREASQARDRYESSRARFMRLAQVAEQLQQRAVVDLKLGNEGNARRLLVEKKKVMTAADVSKRRSQLFELLSVKLSEAISQKDTQLMAALSSVPANVIVNEEPTVRVIFPKESSPVSFDEVLEQELEDILSAGVSEQPSLGPSEEDGDRNAPLCVEAVEDAERDGDGDAGTAIREEDLLAFKTVRGPGLAETTEHENNDSSRKVWAESNRRETSKNEVESQLWDEMENAAKDLERDVLSLKEESDTLASELDSILFSDEEDSTESSSRDETEDARFTENTRMDILDEEAEAKMEINNGDEKSSTVKEEKSVTKIDVNLLFEEYLLDIDSQVAGLESKLQSFLVIADIFVGSNSKTKDERVVQVKNLLQEVQSLRTRILDGVNMSIGQQSQ